MLRSLILFTGSFFVSVVLQAQMNVLVRLESTEPTTITISKAATFQDLEEIVSEEVSDKKVELTVPLSSDELATNPVLYCAVSNSKGMVFGAYIPGVNEEVEIDVRSKKMYYDRKGRFNKYSNILYSLEYPEVKQQRMKDELAYLSSEFPSSDYVHLIIYNAYASGAITETELADFIPEDSDSYWLSLVEEFNTEKETLLREFFDTLGYLATHHDVVMLKFWGSWCKPCLADNDKLKAMSEGGRSLPTILGVQYDKTLSTGTFYPNVLDAKGMISHHFQVSAFPTYVIISGNEVIVKTHVLTEALAYSN